MHFCVFSYNRGQFLENCIASLEQCVPDLQLTIYDDNSNDPGTTQILEKYASTHTVVQPEPNEKQASKFGGLYANIQRALDALPQNSLACFIQDDMQMVRPLDDDDLASIQKFYQVYPQAAFVYPTFMKGCNRKRDKKNTQWDENAQVYHRGEGLQSAGVNFSAVFIGHVERLRRANWRFENREKKNDIKSGKVFGKMGFLAHPFCAYLPNVPAYRGKSKTLALKIAEKINKIGFYPFEIMTSAQVKEFKTRDLQQLPVAEDFLSLKTQGIQEPWQYSPLEGTRFLKRLNRVEVYWRSSRKTV